MKLSEIIAKLQQQLDTQGDIDFGGYTIVPITKLSDHNAPRLVTNTEREIVKEKPAKAKDEDYVEPSLHQQRLGICEQCPEYTTIKIPFTSDTKVHQCLKCGCVMELKTRVKWMKCPLGKW